MDQINEQNPNPSVATMPPIEPANVSVTPQKPETGGLLQTAKKLFMFEKDPGAHPNPIQETPVTNIQQAPSTQHISEWQHPTETQVNNFPQTPETTASSQPELSSVQAAPQESTPDPIPPLEPMQSSTADTQTSFGSTPTIEQPVAQEQPTITQTSAATMETLPSLTPESNPNTPVLENTTLQSQTEQLPVEPVVIATPEPTMVAPVQETVQTIEPTQVPVTPVVAEAASFGQGVDPKEPFADITPQQPIISSETQTQPVSEEIPNSTFPTQSEVTPISPIQNVNTLATEPAPIIPTETQAAATDAPLASKNETENNTENPQTPPTQIKYS